MTFFFQYRGLKQGLLGRSSTADLHAQPFVFMFRQDFANLPKLALNSPCPPGWPQPQVAGLIDVHHSCD